MFVRSLVTHLLVYRVFDRLRLWGAYLRLLGFARRGVFAGYLAMGVFMAAGIGILGAWEYTLRFLRGVGLPEWGHILLLAPVLLPVVGLFVLGFDLWLWGLRGPDQPVFRNLFWSETNEARYRAHLAWVKARRDKAAG